MNVLRASLLLLSEYVLLTLTQEYQVADIYCEFGEGGERERLEARIRKPEGFRAHPRFADTIANSLTDAVCQIRQESQYVYRLMVTDFSSCGVARKDGFATVRVWFPQLEGVMLASDKEVLVMCKPTAPTVTENRVASFAGALPSPGRVSGMVKESPDRLEYEVALYREVTSRSGEALTPSQAVPIGSKLQLRASINAQSTWKFVKLMEVTVSSDPREAKVPGHVVLVRDGCRVQEYSSIVPRHPQQASESPGEVILDFEAFMLDSRVKESSQLWIHTTIKACIDFRDCMAELCYSLDAPTGHGRRRRRVTLYAEGLLEVADDHHEVVLPTLTPDHYHTAESPTTSPLPDDSPTTLPPSTDSPAEPPLSPATLPSASTSAQEDSESSEEQDTDLPEALPQSSRVGRNSTKFGENVGFTVVMPEEFFTRTEAMYQSCATFMVLSGLLGVSMLLGVCALSLLASRIHRTAVLAHATTLETVIKDHHSKYGLRDFLKPPFQ
ncbi:uncharacterized protein LOC127001655 isoform X2 [Eriocheir sinensis]|uniref:uncharacterized protein LOC127001655 isoform X2 n=1 Tax=Eriocheir sinensis TaxID=95602 RepID=UPI0021C5872D|nr:uncharacterized protein LOC127001655 isoform X2 [Eriocheir sinensis]